MTLVSRPQKVNRVSGRPRGIRDEFKFIGESERMSNGGVDWLDTWGLDGAVPYVKECDIGTSVTGSR